MACLDEPTVIAFVAGRVVDTDPIDDHLADCQSCRDLVVWAAQTTFTPGPATTSHDEEPPQADRYAISELIGTGGQGLVYAASDTVLERTVALKVLRPERQAEQILTEARLVARLNHPNIVAVYDAGTTRDGAIYLAMERVAQSLEAWRAGKSQREILLACVDAGRGLVAAHEAGIVHRDIKPSNILIGDGRARLTDFGLALEREASPGDGLAGTLAYMAPEQLDGVASTATDQFSLAVAIWESLTGELPFPGATIEAKRLAIAAGPPAARLPRHVGRALRRALAADPQHRFPDVAAFVAALATDVRARRSRWLLLAGGAAVVMTSVAVAATRHGGGPACSFDDGLPVWDDAARAHLTNQFATITAPYAATAATAARRALDRYAKTWIDAKTRTCELRGSEPDALFAARNACLDERKAAFAAVVRTLSAADAEVVRRATEITDGLPSLASCDDTTWLAQRVHPPEDVATRVKVVALDLELADSTAALHAGKITTAIAIARRAMAESTAIDHAPTRARVALALGEALAHLPDNAAAEAALEQATQWAQRGRDDRVAAEAFIELVKVVGYGLGRFDEALRQAGFADATIARIGDDPVLRATLDYHRCAVYDQLARFDDATKSCASALAARTTAFGADDASVADVLVLEARIASNQAAHAQAADLARRALAIREHVYGATHPALVESLYELGRIQARLGKLDDADASYDRAMTLAIPAFGDASAVVASLWASRAEIAYARGQFPAALAAIDRSTTIREQTGTSIDLVFNLLMRGRILDDTGVAADAAVTLARARDVAEKLLGPDHPTLAAILQDLGRVHGKLGDLKAARAELDRAIAIAAKTHDRNHEAAGEAALAEMLHAAKQPRDAIPYYERALATYEAVFGADAPQLLPTLENLALAHLDLHRPALALPLLQRAIAIETKTTGEASPRLVTPLDSRGDAELALGHRDQARATWTSALALPEVEKLFPDDAKDVKTKLARLH